MLTDKYYKKDYILDAPAIWQGLLDQYITKYVLRPNDSRIHDYLHVRTFVEHILVIFRA